MHMFSESIVPPSLWLSGQLFPQFRGLYSPPNVNVCDIRHWDKRSFTPNLGMPTIL
ncbi:hypothetical protein PAXRUDRAFT_730435 [Paxillus rubicundulus Ve08.2h10]|uniref:Uncharacterized protein n=1 Tax=Paxillus rubicundulus Ve08.2h10 TaxID=930991 RepID=A0A0D0E7Y3_9AGAM|nr:hypothetical protein PAXRUDRAFT_730435 [Paxillus rubicundulus Ve08.2h10]